MPYTREHQISLNGEPSGEKFFLFRVHFHQDGSQGAGDVGNDKDPRQDLGDCSESDFPFGRERGTNVARSILDKTTMRINYASYVLTLVFRTPF